MQSPLGGGRAPATPAERAENTTAAWMAQVYTEALNAGGVFPLALHPAPDLHYVKAWRLPGWQRLLARRDLELLVFDWCAWRQPGARGARQRMACLAPRVPGLAARLGRTCSCDPAEDAAAHARPPAGTRPAPAPEAFVADWLELLDSVLRLTPRGGPGRVSFSPAVLADDGSSADLHGGGRGGGGPPL